MDFQEWLARTFTPAYLPYFRDAFTADGKINKHNPFMRYFNPLHKMVDMKLPKGAVKREGYINLWFRALPHRVLVTEHCTIVFFPVQFASMCYVIEHATKTHDTDEVWVYYEEFWPADLDVILNPEQEAP